MAEMKIDITECVIEIINGVFTDIQSKGYTVSKWISVKDELPVTRETVILYDEYKGVAVGFYDSDYAKFRFVDDVYDSAQVTHWQPLPKPPMEVNKNDN